MSTRHRAKFREILAVAAAILVLEAASPATVIAQEQAATTTQDVAGAPEPLSADEMEVLVARIALYPDDLVALVTSASLYPLQIVEAARFLDAYDKDRSLTPKEGWDGSVISLLNYPQIVRMMSDDLDWTQQLGDAIAFQEKDVLIAIQQLRSEAVANGAVKSDDKLTVTTENDNVVIRSASPDVVYIPQYQPEMLYAGGYSGPPIGYYPDPYPNYWYPTATFFAATVTGAVWAAAVDWNDWGVWGGRWNGDGIDVNCNHCFNNRDFNGRINLNDVDWRNVDRSRLGIDRDQFNRIDRNNLTSRVRQDGGNSIRNRARDLKGAGVAHRPGNVTRSADVRRSMQGGLKKTANAPAVRGDKGRVSSRPSAARKEIKRPSHVKRTVGKPRPGGRVDARPRRPSALGHVDRGRVSKVHSSRGHRSMGGGIHRGGGGHKAIRRGGGRRR